MIVKPFVYIKQPWKLVIGNHCWIGEEVRIDNLDEVIIGNDVCISQRTYLLTGNHDYGSETFDLITKKIIIEDGVWIGASSLVCPGSILRTHSVLTAGSVFSGISDAYGIYKGNPAVKIKERIIR